MAYSCVKLLIIMEVVCLIRVWRLFYRFILGLLLLVVAFLGFLTAVEYRPDDIESVPVLNEGSQTLMLDQAMTLMTFNIGYGGLGATEDFVMDGGEKGRPDDKSVVEGFLSGITELMLTYEADVYFMQEVDRPSRRSYYIDQVELLHETVGLEQYSMSFALNFKALFVPFPVSLTDHIGRVESGMQTLSVFEQKHAERYQFPGKFSWPVRVVNLKRAMLVNRIEIADSEQDLYLINVHLSAYDDGSMRALEMALLREFIQELYNAGHYVIVGGDFNQTFPDAEGVFPVVNTDHFEAAVIEEGYFGDNFSFTIDPTLPTSRLLNQPYEPDDPKTQYYIIDGFLISDNIELIDVYTIDAAFEHSDHNPVMLEVKLKP